MNFYEKVVILDPDLDDTAVEEVVNNIKQVIARQGGEIIKTENWGRRKLAYELNKRQKGNYVLLYFKSPPSTIAELERYCKVVDSIIKFMVIKLTKKKQIEAVLPSPSPSDVDTGVSPGETKPLQGESVESPGSETSPEGKKDV
jgi:small subunit ribosomal protein S6